MKRPCERKPGRFSRKRGHRTATSGTVIQGPRLVGQRRKAAVHSPAWGKSRPGVRDGETLFLETGGGHGYTEPQRDARPLLRKKAVRRQRLHVRRELSGAASGSELPAFRAGGQAHGAQPGGVSFLPRFTVERDLAQGPLVEIAVPMAERSADILCVHHRNHEEGPALRCFREFFAEAAAASCF